ncbi:MAG: hypothetical protein RLZZ262_1660 [Bacteroidota bacterium]
MRFLAAFAVLLTHVEFTKKLLGHGEALWVDLHSIGHFLPIQGCINGTTRWIAPILSMLGEIGVVFFFVLSGFLITFLLLKEKEVTNGVAIGKFYLRRLLRIWPLYLLIVLLGFFILPYVNAFEIFQQQRYMWYGFGAQLVLYLCMLPNMAFAHFNIAIPNIGQAWSIGVEEQFYLIWPWLIGRSKRIITTILGFLIVWMGLKVVAVCLPTDCCDGMATIKRFLGMTKMESMAIGAIGAYLVHSKQTLWLNFLYHPWIQRLSWFAVLPLIYFMPLPLMSVYHLIESFFFLVIIINVASNSESLVQMRWSWLDFLGRISYGIYMYHMIIITLVIYLVKGHIIGFERLTTTQNVIVYTLSSGLTIFVAYLSYRFFEMPWMKLKERFTTIVSGEAARKSSEHV